MGKSRDQYQTWHSHQLLRLTPSDSARRQRLEKRIRDTPLVAERAWLLEKARGSGKF